MKTLLLIFLLAASFQNTSSAATSTACGNNRNEFLKRNLALYEEYSQIDSKQNVTDDKKAIWIEGNPKVNKALFIAHGYMGSPGEMLFLAQPFIKKGWSIVGFLIPGHGSSYEIANKYKNTRWIEEFKIQLELATSCFSEVRGIGFSTGGLLFHQYALTNATPSSLKSLHLVSPFFIQRFGGFFDRILGFFVNGISVDTAYSLTKFRDLKVMTKDRQFYNQNIPIDAGLQVKELGQKVFEMNNNSQLKIPVQVFLSEGDWTVDTDVTKQVMNRDYEEVQLVWYKGAEPHHLMVPSVSKVAGEVQRLIFSFEK